MSAVKALIAETQETLGFQTSADRLETMSGKLKACISERTKRLKAITAKDTSTFGGNPGPERQKVVETGDLEALRALDEEEREIGSELEVLRDLQNKLSRLLGAQRGLEYGQGMRGEFAELDNLLKAQAEAAVEAHKTRQAVETKMKEIHSHRHHITRQNTLHGLRLELPAATPELLASYMRVNGYSYHRGPQRVGWFSPTGSPQELKKIAETLGVPVPRPDQEPVALLAG